MTAKCRQLLWLPRPDARLAMNLGSRGTCPRPAQKPRLCLRRAVFHGASETARVSRRPQSDRGSGFEKQRAPAGGVWDMLRSALRALSELIAGTYNLTPGSLPLFAVPWRAGAGVMTLFQANESEARMM